MMTLNLNLILPFLTMFLQDIQVLSYCLHHYDLDLDPYLHCRVVLKYLDLVVLPESGCSSHHWQLLGVQWELHEQAQTLKNKNVNLRNLKLIPKI